jgi:HEAT repeat protein
VDAAVVLLQNDDVSAVDFVADRVLQTSPPLDGTTQQHINTALLGRLKNPLAIPALIRLLGSTDATVRRGAAASLRRTQSQGALEPLARTGLEDADQTVRYFAVMGLAELVGDYQHGPAITVYRQNESMYLDYWRTWRAGMFP